jgi:hypothetical protein
MSYSLSLEDRKQQFEAEKVKFDHTISGFSIQDLQNEATTGYKVKKLAVMEDQLSAKQVIELTHRQNIDYVIQNSLQPLSEKIKTLAVIDKNSSDFYLDDFTFFSTLISKHKIIFDSNTPRKTILNLAFHRLEVDVEANRSHHLKSALEELIMNAQIDARNLGHSKENLKSTLLIEKMEKMVAVSIIDLYGTLTYGKFTGQIESVLNIGVTDSINHNRQRGAGIGSSIIFNAADSLYLGCIPGEKTRVTAIIPFGLSDTNQEKLQKSLFLL